MNSPTLQLHAYWLFYWLVLQYQWHYLTALYKYKFTYTYRYHNVIVTHIHADINYQYHELSISPVTCLLIDSLASLAVSVPLPHGGHHAGRRSTWLGARPLCVVPSPCRPGTRLNDHFNYRLLTHLNRSRRPFSVPASPRFAVCSF